MSTSPLPESTHSPLSEFPLSKSVTDYSESFHREGNRISESNVVDSESLPVSNDSITESVTESVTESKSTTIKHIVISGGGVYGLSAYGALKYLNEQGKWNIENIQTIYGTSVGAIVSVILALKYEWSIVDDYFIKRPWNNVFQFKLFSIVQSFETRGIFNITHLEEIFKPLFGGKDVPINITMKEFYDLNHLELHFITVDLNTFVPVDLSYKTHPNWRLMDAVYCSAALPLIFAPFKKVSESLANGGPDSSNENEFYLDGGVICAYPLQNCIDNGANLDEILGISKECRNNVDSIVSLTDDSSLIDYILLAFNKLIHKRNKPQRIKIQNEIRIVSEVTSLQSIYLFTNSIEERNRLIDAGVAAAKNWFMEQESLTDLERPVASAEVSD